MWTPYTTEKCSRCERNIDWEGPWHVLVLSSSPVPPLQTQTETDVSRDIYSDNCGVDFDGVDIYDAILYPFREFRTHNNHTTSEKNWID